MNEEEFQEREPDAEPDAELDAEPVDVALELELELPVDLNNVPPIGVPGGGKVEGTVAFLAKREKASRVFPVEGALIEPTIPFWQ